MSREQVVRIGILGKGLYQMKKFASLLVVLSMGLFSVGMVGCGGATEDTDTTEPGVTAPAEGDAGGETVEEVEETTTEEEG